MNTVVLIPAYGRVYTTWKAAKMDWDEGKDFKIEGGPYTSIRDEEALNIHYDEIIIKYGKNLEKYNYI